MAYIQEDNIVQTNATANGFKNYVYKEFCRGNYHIVKFVIDGANPTRVNFESEIGAVENQSFREGTLEILSKQGQGRSRKEIDRAAFLAFGSAVDCFRWDDRLSSVVCELEDGANKAKFTYVTSGDSHNPNNPCKEKIGVMIKESK